MKSWKEKKMLSKVRKKVLLKSVVHVIPTYSMNYIKFPFGLCNELQSLMTKFWWGYKLEKKAID